jgi:hypothetical protein
LPKLHLLNSQMLANVKLNNLRIVLPTLHEYLSKFGKCCVSSHCLEKSHLRSERRKTDERCCYRRENSERLCTVKLDLKYGRRRRRKNLRNIDANESYIFIPLSVSELFFNTDFHLKAFFYRDKK